MQSIMSEEDSAVVAAPAMEDAPLKDKEEEKQNLADGSDDEESQGLSSPWIR